jgi:spore germination protein GerM
MKRERLGLAAIVILFILGGGLLAYAYKAVLFKGRKDESLAGTPKLLSTYGSSRAHLYFIDENHQFLKAEERTLGRQDNAVARAKSMISGLIEGPKSHLLPALPQETKLLALYITEDGVGYADFNKAISERHPGGCLTELLTIFSVVNTLALNLEEVERVKILIEGREAQTLAGHIDIRFPFSPNILMIK